MLVPHIQQNGTPFLKGIVMTRKFPYLLTVLALVWFSNLSSQAQQLPSLKSPEFEGWRTTIKQTPLPRQGCFKASFPATEWQEVTCGAAPNRPIGQPRVGNTPTVGNGPNDFVGTVTGLLSEAEGSFPVVSDVTSSNAYSLQLNTNTFSPSSSICTNGCLGWQQFVYTSSPSQLYMQYWLIGYGTSCPSGWMLYGTDDCYKSTTATDISSQPITNLPVITITGEASGGTDTALMETPNGEISAVGQDSVLNLEQVWNIAEFNIFGDGDLLEVNLNSGATLLVQLSLDNGTNQVPGYKKESFTGETNNLTLVASAPCLYGGTSPMIQFVESNTTATQTCGVSGANPVELSPTHFSFIGKPSSGDQYKTITLTNETSSTVTIESVSSGRFLWGGCPSTLPVNGSCVTSVGFDFLAYAQGETFDGALTITTSVGTVGATLSAYVK